MDQQIGCSHRSSILVELFNGHRQNRKATPISGMDRFPTVSGTTNLVDILDRILDKGLVIAGDIRISLANVELLTVRIRLLVCSVDKAEQIGLNWWKHDPNLTAPAHTLPPTRTLGRPPRAQASRTKVSTPAATRRSPRKKS